MNMNTNSGAMIRYIYKIAPANPAPSLLTPTDTDASAPVLPPSDLDKSSKFIHMSTASQIAGTLQHFFKTTSDTLDVVYLLKVGLTPDLETNSIVRWESPDASTCGPRDGEGMFPHLYLEHEADESRRLWLKRNEIESVQKVASELGQDGWVEGLRKLIEEGWLK